MPPFRKMHRLAVDVQHWMNDKQFADVLAISQLSPAPCRRRGAGLCHAVWVLLVLSDENR